MDASVDFAAQEASRFQHAQMLGNGGEGNVKRLGEFFDGGFSLCETSKNGTARGVGQSAKRAIQSG